MDAHPHVVLLAQAIAAGGDGLQALRREAEPPYLYDRRVLFGFLKAGVTTVVHMGGGGDDILRVRDMIARGELVGPRLVVGKRINGPPKAVLPWLKRTLQHSTMEQPQTAADARAVVAAKARGYEFIKAYQHLDEATYAAVVGTARDEQMPVFGHLPELGCERCVRFVHPFDFPLDNIAHAEELGSYAMRRDFAPSDFFVLTELVRRSGAGLTPTLMASRAIAHMFVERELPLPAPSVLRYVDPVTLYSWQPARERFLGEPFRRQPDIHKFPASYDFSRVLTRELWKAGVRLTVGTDAPLPGVPYGFSVRDEMRELGALGLGARDILQAATRNAHQLLHQADRAGSARAGQRADLLLLDANPLEDIANVERMAGIIVNGRWLSAADIDRAMEDNILYYRKLDRQIGRPMSR